MFKMVSAISCPLKLFFFSLVCERKVLQAQVQMEHRLQRLEKTVPDTFQNDPLLKVHRPGYLNVD